MVGVGEGPGVTVLVGVGDGPCVAVLVGVGEGPGVSVVVGVGDGPSVAVAVGVGDAGGGDGPGDRCSKAPISQAISGAVFPFTGRLYPRWSTANG